MSQNSKYWLGATVAGAVLAILFVILAIADSSRAGVYISAAVVCGGIGLVSYLTLRASKS